MTLAVSVFFGLVAINAVMLAAIGAALGFGWWAGIVVSIIGALTTVTVSILRQRPSLAWAGILALPAGALAGMDYANYAELSRQPYVKEILVAEAPSHADAGAFSFRDASVRADLWGKSTRKSKQTQDYYAAPVVGDGWTTDQPVTVWAVCDDAMYGCRSDWRKPFRAGVRPSSPVPEHFSKAIAEAETGRGLTSAPGAVMIVWVGSVEDAIAAPRDGVWFGFQLWNMVWLVTFVGTAAVTKWRARAVEPAAPA